MLRFWKWNRGMKLIRRGVGLKTAACVTTACTASGVVLISAVAIAPVSDGSRRNTKDVWAYAGALRRFLRSVRIGLTISLDYWLTNFYLDPERSDYQKRISLVHIRNANRLLDGCLLNGGTYIKIGQGLVSLSHILPKEYIHTLGLLQDKCLTREDDEVYQIFMEEFGKTPDQMYAKFEPVAIAAASLSQVFVAYTNDNEKVAVKVQYRDLQERFRGDVSTIDFLLKIGAYMNPTFDFGWILEDLKENLRSELDFVNEAKNTERCAKDLEHLPFIYVPKVHWDLCSKRVLVTEYVDGLKISDKELLRKNGHSLADIDHKMFKAFGEQIFQVGFVHADPHPGNVFVRKHNNESQLVLLDHGLYQHLEDTEKMALSNFWQAMVLHDCKKMQQFSKELGVDNYSEFAEVLTQTPLTREFKLVTRLTQEQLDYFAEVAQTRFDIITKTLKDMPRSLLFVIRNLNTLRAIAHDHGDPVNRYTILARIATKTAFKSSDSFVKKLRSIPTRLSFEYRLFMQQFWTWFISSYLIFLKKIGRSPDASILLAIIK